MSLAITISGRHKMIILIVVLTTTEVYPLEGQDFLNSNATYSLNKNSLIQKNNEFSYCSSTGTRNIIH
jgi:hypothetical protein